MLTRGCGCGCMSLLAGILVVAGLLAWLAAREADIDFDTEAARAIYHTRVSSLVPGPGLPEDLEVYASNNVIDLVQFEDRTYLAFRTAPTHYAYEHARLVLLSSPDRRTWTREHEFMLDTDLREPRFLVFQGRLFLYFLKCGRNPLAFEPQGSFVTERQADGSWTPPEPIYKPGYVVWRARTHDGLAYMSVYNGVGMYSITAPPGEVRLLTSGDGRNWKAISDAPQVNASGAEEGDFEFDADGNLVAMVRLEMLGSMVCTAPKEDLGCWTCGFTPHKFDGPFLFRRGQDFYVIARRGVDGAFNRGADFLPATLERLYYLLRYSQTRKRTTLYKLDPGAREMHPLLDFPSCGDTAYAAMIPLDAHSYYTVYYSTPYDGPDWPWTLGQVIGCHIYQTTLTFP